jgi:hypothetical protein
MLFVVSLLALIQLVTWPLVPPAIIIGIIKGLL